MTIPYIVKVNVEEKNVSFGFVYCSKENAVRLQHFSLPKSNPLIL